MARNATPPRLALDKDAFLRRHWQREALFIPAGIAEFAVPADADELAGLAMEDDVDSRMVWQDGGGEWKQQAGPFEADAFSRPGPWSLLVKGIDAYWDGAALLSQCVDFLPRWRFDDVLMSYATNQGSAGPHFDRYDVFIIQGTGKRRWQLGQFCDANTPMAEGGELQVLANFEPAQEFLMCCGDILYIPPGQAHYGISDGESTSFSLGFRAPRMSDLLAHWTDSALAGLSDHVLYRDPLRTPQRFTGELLAQDVAYARQQLQELLDCEDDTWFGQTLSEPSPNAPNPPNADEANHAVCDDDRVALEDGYRILWSQEDDGALRVFSHGESRIFPFALRDTVERIISQDSLTLGELRAMHGDAANLLDWLREGGSVVVYGRD